MHSCLGQSQAMQRGQHVNYNPRQDRGTNHKTKYAFRNSFHESLKQIGSTQHQGNAVGAYETVQHFNDIKEHLHVVKRDVQQLIQRNVPNPGEKVVKCPELPPMPSCLSTAHFVVFVVVQSILFFAYIMYKSQQEAAAKKFF
ncbi:protein ERGIC-53 [Aplochiton taeniatus]